MDHYLVFQIYAPLVSWGEAAVGEVRHTSMVPSRSALLGLLAAALGIRRDDSARLAVFNQHYHIAVRPLSDRETWLTDYHTVQMPKENRKVPRYTRRDELRPEAGQALETMLTSREYRCDAYYHIAISATPGAPYSLTALRDALQSPVFTLYFGRKSCPPALPLAPHLFSGDLAEVWRQASQTPALNDPALRSIGCAEGVCYWEQESGTGLTPHYRVERNDQPADRRRWQFTSRVQYVGRAKGEG
ncbi:type I-E CRISPR-associated protein Cas5/CasD [Pectobacterium cacticida]|uniref:Type I-E CRISPR-associated protein Cas5/CasD n=1 Tax=Pectobacterium cacticida TaxID=69221 RepID=A0ABZ2GAT7_9GAMM|nr:type I-E CRISPR-associated protein Cas5/CasD [Pectobacterium cacticida]UYX07319.1 type I-E CRISPR-associated protein Cas5/CasD [Pectobacterium cacticida]